ncbi:DUF3299 domain-containing protein [Pelomonas sp. CA6]|uniref:DUF3299 domain-containing protein n=1 Tax=Pelomonas sp. CA6 TaxID=2907999 RepID=UPI001F4BE14C|nr:DUF3299 domain-containing protein [Pelomonas sp. CA6]MCH7345584.1 DUF3299 domain-containing protein [Pelomonas sp. CA6]
MTLRTPLPMAALAALIACAAALPAGAQTGASMPMGQGPGYHDPRSPFKPLQEQEGVLSWKLLSSVSTRMEKNAVIPQFPNAVQKLDRQTVRVQGFMLPLEPGDKQRHFLLSAVPTSCSFCVPAGPEGLVEVRSRNPVRYTLEPVQVEGQFSVLSSDPYGMFYRVTDARETGAGR